jgi:hypothetical protein
MGDWSGTAPPLRRWCCFARSYRHLDPSQHDPLLKGRSLPVWEPTHCTYCFRTPSWSFLVLRLCLLAFCTMSRSRCAPATHPSASSRANRASTSAEDERLLRCNRAKARRVGGRRQCSRSRKTENGGWWWWRTPPRGRSYLCMGHGRYTRPHETQVEAAIHGSRVSRG